MQITFYGAARTVTGSMHLLEANGMRLLLDCGLYQGRRKESYQRNLNFPFAPQTIDAVILSHAHVDHCGNLPNLFKQGFNGPVYATPASAHLVGLILAGWGINFEADVVFANKYRRARGDELLKPLYTEADAARLIRHLRGIPYGEEFSPANGVTARFVDSGHILGAAAVDLQVEERHSRTRLWFSGDIGRSNQQIVRNPVLPEETDVLVMESTYGDKPRRDPGLALNELREALQSTCERGGKLIIPSSVIGQAQELFAGLHSVMSSKPALRLPVYVDSRLAPKVVQAFAQFPDCYDESTRALILQNRHPALNFEQSTYFSSLEESRVISAQKQPMVIISPSAMAENGRILHHLRNHIEDARATILLTSWQAPRTLGRRLADREERVMIFGEVYYRQAQVVTIGGFSVHADQDLLAEYALRVRSSARRVFLVHGEDAPAQALMERLAEQGMCQVYAPGARDSVEF
ncbi:MAG: MBL fold metallo-hydrolase [Anaerolineales bacterium]